VAPAPVKTEPAPGDPAWLAPRLESAKLAVLRAAGFETEAEAKAAADAIKAQRDSQKTIETQLAEAKLHSDKLKGRADAITALLTEQVTENFGALTEAQKTAVRLQAADDAPAEDRLRAIRQVKAMAAALAGTAPPPAAVVPAPAAAAPPANTAPGRTAPAGGDTSQPNHRAVYEDMSKSNPFAAAQYATQNPDAYKTA
jgi:hypothetical protein